MRKDQRNLVILSYYFPPFPAVAGLRVKGMARYLPRYGWNVWVLTPNLGVNPKEELEEFNLIQINKESLLLRVTHGSHMKHHLSGHTGSVFQNVLGIFRKIVGYNEILSSVLLDLVAILDYSRLREEFMHAFEEIHREFPVDAIISTSPPESINLIARDIATKYNIPWIVDYRDLWAYNDIPAYRRTKVGRTITKWIEYSLVKDSRTIFVTSEESLKRERELFKGKPIVVVKNGFDPTELEEKIHSQHSNFGDSYECSLTITYTGSFYKKLRNPLPVVYAIQDLINEGKISISSIHLRLVGPNLSEDIIEELKKYPFVTYTPWVSREQALTLQHQSDVLLLLFSRAEEHTIPAKLFEYLYAKKLILAVGSIVNKPVVEILENTRAGFFVTTDNVKMLKNIILELYSSKLNGDLQYITRKITNKRIFKYSQHEMAKKISHILDLIVRKR